MPRVDDRYQLACDPLARDGVTKTVGLAAKREAVVHFRTAFGYERAPGCTLIAVDRTMVRNRSRRPPATELRARQREIANQRRRFGYQRLFILLRREGEPLDINRIYRLYREEELKRLGTRTEGCVTPGMRYE